MASGKKCVQQFARNLFTLSLENGTLSDARVAGVLDYIEKHRPAQSLQILRAYRRLIAAEVARGRAVVEHAGPLSEAMLQEIGRAMTRRYGRNVTPVARRNDGLLAGLRIRVADDLYEQSVASQLASLAQAV